MVISIKLRGKQYFIQSKATRRSPELTPYRSKAWKFDSLSQCQCIRDDVLEYFSGAVISS